MCSCCEVNRLVRFLGPWFTSAKAASKSAVNNLLFFFSLLFAGLLTRNSSFELEESKSSSSIQKKKIFDAIATASIISNSAGIDTSRSQIITLSNFSKFLETKQLERLSEAEVIALIRVSSS